MNTGNKLHVFDFSRARAREAVKKIQKMEELADKMLDLSLIECQEVLDRAPLTDKEDFKDLSHYIKMKDSFIKDVSILEKMERYIAVKRGIIPKDIGKEGEESKTMAMARKAIEIAESKH